MLEDSCVSINPTSSVLFESLTNGSRNSGIASRQMTPLGIQQIALMKRPLSAATDMKLRQQRERKADHFIVEMDCEEQNERPQSSPAVSQSTPAKTKSKSSKIDLTPTTILAKPRSSSVHLSSLKDSPVPKPRRKSLAPVNSPETLLKKAYECSELKLPSSLKKPVIRFSSSANKTPVKPTTRALPVRSTQTMLRTTLRRTKNSSESESQSLDQSQASVKRVSVRAQSVDYSLRNMRECKGRSRTNSLCITGQQASKIPAPIKSRR
ncbi:hypothetical protein Ciccas_006521 [Cichlidogyrus casuarinus]|uniref:Uncharacterized protein n=1 Tax=Cichlidogyrus casuarinus TaxID=1844966 RepID=A0ABD2Q7X0_9PLAT